MRDMILTLVALRAGWKQQSLTFPRPVCCVKQRVCRQRQKQVKKKKN